MQIITREQPNIHTLFNEFDSLYAEFSEHTNTNELMLFEYGDVFNPLIDIFKKYGYYGNIMTHSKTYSPIEIHTNDNNVIVCFSSGKDSIATVKYFMDKGYNVYLYHMRHINPPLHDEYIQAQKLAEYWGIPIYVDTVKLSGKHEYVEHPMKNYMIANGALQWGIRENITTNIAFGNYYTSTLDMDNFEFCGGDDIEMWEIYNTIIQSIIPDFEMQVVLSNLNETLGIVCGNKELMEMSVSCLGRASMRNYWHDWVKNKYGIILPKHRCGRCYKCCVEYIYMTDHDLQEYNKEYYKYCLTNLKKNVQREDAQKYTDEEVWQHYFFYDISESKYYS